MSQNNRSHGKVRSHPWLTKSTFAMSWSQKTAIHMAFYWHHLPRPSHCHATRSWISWERHTRNKMAPVKDSMNSFTLYADVSLWLVMFLFASGVDSHHEYCIILQFVQWVTNIYHAQSYVLPRKRWRIASPNYIHNHAILHNPNKAELI